MFDIYFIKVLKEYSYEKKIVGFILLIATVCCAVFALSACGTSGGNVAKVQMNKKYIYESEVNREESLRTYYIFYSDGTGKYRYYDGTYDDVINFYTISFKYTFADGDKSSVVCFYDSVEYCENYNASKNVSTTWSKLLTVSKNVLCETSTYGYYFYINEDYLKTIPNFGK